MFVQIVDFNADFVKEGQSEKDALAEFGMKFVDEGILGHDPFIVVETTKEDLDRWIIETQDGDYAVAAEVKPATSKWLFVSFVQP